MTWSDVVVECLKLAFVLVGGWLISGAFSQGIQSQEVKP